MSEPKKLYWISKREGDWWSWGIEHSEEGGYPAEAWSMAQAEGCIEAHRRAVVEASPEIADLRAERDEARVLWAMQGHDNPEHGRKLAAARWGWAATEGLGETFARLFPHLYPTKGKWEEQGVTTYRLGEGCLVLGAGGQASRILPGGDVVPAKPLHPTKKDDQ